MDRTVDGMIFRKSRTIDCKGDGNEHMVILLSDSVLVENPDGTMEEFGLCAKVIDRIELTANLPSSKKSVI